jgi:hypothetical protein
LVLLLLLLLVLHLLVVLLLVVVVLLLEDGLVLLAGVLPTGRVDPGAMAKVRLLTRRRGPRRVPSSPTL